MERGNLTPRILFEDTHLVVLSKPAGLLSQGEETGSANLVDWLRVYFGRNYVGLVHRLDRNTSGLMVVAKRSKSADRLTRSLQDGSLQRVYRAWCEGTLAQPAVWKHWLLKDERTNTVRTVKGGTPGAKAAELAATPIEARKYRDLPLTLVEFKLETGRSHQIRVQAAAEGHPLLGDPKYGSKNNVTLTFPRTALHSFRLDFPHPMSGEAMAFEDPLPEDLRLE